jgi:23S rRNA pseudouridine1911/1915/1917 synthase
MDPQILYEDNHLFVVCKPAGILTQPSGTQQKNLEDICKAWLKKTYNKPGNIFLEAVHRLDKSVSGIVVFARTSKALSRLNAALRQQQFRKVYLAIVEGLPEKSVDTLEHYLLHDAYQSLVVSVNRPGAKLCRLHYQVLKHANQTSLVEVILETGRYHQIRAQLAAIGKPIVGDAKYGSQKPCFSPGIALHHSELMFPHPTLGKSITLHATLPEEMLKLL